MKAFEAYVFSGIQPGSNNQQGELVELEYRSWLEMTQPEKEDTMEQLASWFVELYIYEFNTIIMKRFHMSSRHSNSDIYDELSRNRKKKKPEYFKVFKDIAKFQNDYSQQMIRTSDNDNNIVRDKCKCKQLCKSQNWASQYTLLTLHLSSFFIRPTPRGSKHQACESHK